MTDPRRLLEECTDDFEVQLLAAGRADAMSKHSRRRILAGLGVATLLPGSLAVASTKAGAKGSLLLAGFGGGVKWLAIGAVSAAATWAGTHQLLTDEPISSAQPVTVPVPSDWVLEAMPVAPESPQPMAELTEEAKEDELIPEAAPKTRTAGRSAARRSLDTNSLAEEIAHIDRARAALQSGSPALTMQLLESHRTKFPKAALRSEATVLRIQALLASGNRSAAEQLAERFLANHQNGPYAKRVRSLVDSPRRVETNP